MYAKFKFKYHHPQAKLARDHRDHRENALGFFEAPSNF